MEFDMKPKYWKRSNSVVGYENSKNNNGHILTAIMQAKWWSIEFSGRPHSGPFCENTILAAYFEFEMPNRATQHENPRN